jgi:hypothetical protein
MVDKIVHPYIYLVLLLVLQWLSSAWLWLGFTWLSEILAQKSY